MFQVVPTVLAIMLAAPCAGLLLKSPEIKPTELPQIIAGSISGATVGVVTWLIMVLIDRGSSAGK